MLIVKRLVVWAVETVGEATFLAFLLPVFSAGMVAIGELGGLLWFIRAELLIFGTSGYLLTTGVARAAWKNTRVWSYPVLAATLFEVHFEIVNVAIGGAFNPPLRLAVRVTGGLIAFGCTLIGSFVLRKWASAGETANRENIGSGSTMHGRN